MKCLKPIMYTAVGIMTLLWFASACWIGIDILISTFGEAI